MKARLALLLVALSCAPAVAQNSAQHVTVEQVPFAPGFDLRDAYGDYVSPPDLRERIAQTLGPRAYGVAAVVPNGGPPYLEVMMKGPSAADAATVRAMLGDRSYRIVATHYSADEAQARCRAKSRRLLWRILP